MEKTLKASENEDMSQNGCNPLRRWNHNNKYFFETPSMIGDVHLNSWTHLIRTANKMHKVQTKGRNYPGFLGVLAIVSTLSHPSQKQGFVICAKDGSAKAGARLIQQDPCWDWGTGVPNKAGNAAGPCSSSSRCWQHLSWRDPGRTPPLGGFWG